MKRLAVFLALVLSACGCIKHADGTDPTVERPTRVFYVGDSIAMQTHDDVEALLLTEGATTTARYWPGVNPVGVDYVAWLNAEPGALDYVVFVDVTDPCCDMGGFTPETYVAAVDELVAAIHARGAIAVELSGGHPDVSTVPFDRRLPLPPADDVDGVHYAEAGQQALAAALCAELNEGECNT